MEGEKDCMLACQLGMAAVTVTAGAGSFKPEWVMAFKNKSVAICYDIDEAGRMGAKTIAEYLAGVTKHLKIIELPIKEPANADFTNYIVDNKKTVADLIELIKVTPDYKVDNVKHVAIEDKIYEVELSEASDKAYFFKRIRMNAIVVGKDLAPYLVPKKIKVHCLMGKKVCPYCGIGMKGGDFELIFNEESPEILQLVNCTDMQQERAIREKLEVYGNCRQYNYEILEAQNIEEIKLTPEIKYASSIKEYVVRVAYFLGHGIKTNQSYELVGITAPHPQTQYSTHIVYRYKESDLSIDKFVLTDDIVNSLAVFKCQYNPS
jgi:5S rRNA maturation endonuclease (ribonuclease M5)